MKPTKRYTDPLGRSALVSRYKLHAACLVIAILGSAWPIWPRSIRAAFDTWEAPKPEPKVAPVDEQIRQAALERARNRGRFGSSRI